MSIQVASYGLAEQGERGHQSRALPKKVRTGACRAGDGTDVWVSPRKRVLIAQCGGREPTPVYPGRLKRLCEVVAGCDVV